MEGMRKLEALAIVLPVKPFKNKSMRHPGDARSSRLATILLVVLIAVLPILAWLQFEWTGEASRAETSRMRENLRNTGYLLSTDFEREMSIVRDILLPLGYDQVAEDSAQVRDRLAQALNFWASNSPEKALLNALWFVEQSVDSSFRVTLDANGNASQTIGMIRFDQTLWRLNNDGGQGWEEIDTESAPVSIRAALAGQNSGSGSAVVMDYPVALAPGSRMLLEFNRDILVNELLPRLVERYFGGETGLKGYYIRVSDTQTRELLYSSPGQSEPPHNRAVADLTLPMFASDTGTALVSRMSERDRSRNPDPDRLRDRVLSNPAVRLWILQSTRPEQNPRSFVQVGDARWVLEAIHVDGSVAAAAERIRWVNLAFSSSLLLALLLGLIYLYRLYRKSRLMVRAQNDFVASVSHELKTPLAILRAAAENLKEGVVAQPDQAKRYGERMLSEADRLLVLTDNVLRYAGLNSGHDQLADSWERVNILELLHERIGQWKEGFAAASASLVLELPPADTLASPWVSAHPVALKALLDNLFSNALKHGLSTRTEHNEIRLTLSLSKTRHPGRRSAPIQPWWRIHVLDHGPGIAVRDQKRIFEPFYRPQGTRASGVGLGLSLVHRIALMHGGWVELQSKPGEGASFFVYLPTLQDTSDTAEGQAGA